MFRTRLWLAAAVAVVASGVFPATSRAVFTLVISSSDAGVASQTIVNRGPGDPVVPTAPNGYSDLLTDPNRIGVESFNVSTSTLSPFNGITFAITAERRANATEGGILGTTLAIENTTSTTRNIRFTMREDAFLQPGTAGAQLSFQTILTSITVPDETSSSLRVFSSVAGASTAPIVVVGDQNVDEIIRFSPFVTVTRGANFTGELVFDITLAAGDRAQLTAEYRTSVVPAPATAVLALVGAPVLGLAGWVRRRRAAAAV